MEKLKKVDHLASISGVLVLQFRLSNRHQKDSRPRPTEKILLQWIDLFNLQRNKVDLRSSHDIKKIPGFKILIILVQFRLVPIATGQLWFILQKKHGPSTNYEEYEGTACFLYWFLQHTNILCVSKVQPEVLHSTRCWGKEVVLIWTTNQFHKFLFAKLFCRHFSINVIQQHGEKITTNPSI